MKMLLIGGVLLMFTAPSSVSGLATVGSDCRSDHPCLIYGALGRPLDLQLPSEDELILKKVISGSPGDDIFKFKKQRITKNPSDPRWEFFTGNRTLIIIRAEKEDSGRYRLETFDSFGKDKGVYNFQLIIEAVVSSVTVTYSCFPRVNKSLSCSSDGDQLSFNWTINGTPKEHSLTEGNQTLLLNHDFTGSVTCNVSNHVSHGETTFEGTFECPDSTTTTKSPASGAKTVNGMSSIVASNTTPTPTNSNFTSTGSGSFLMWHLTLILLGLFTAFLIVLSIIVCYIYRKNQAQKNTGSSAGSPQNDQDLLYVQVNHKPRSGVENPGRTAQSQEDEVMYASVVTQPKKKKKKKVQQEDEVQYGEVVFKTPGKQQKGKTEGPEECVYSDIQHNR